MEETIVKIGEVEVSSREEGFKGVWYRAILEENPTKTRHKKLKVRYLTLFNDEGSTHLTEMIDQKFIRPVPPVDLFEDGVVLEEGSVVDADHNDGWWSGVVVKKSEDENTFWVYFDFQPDIIPFERNQLRVHYDWNGFEWVQPDTQELSKSEFSAGTMVEVSSVIDKSEVVWFTAMIIKEEKKKKKFTVKYCNNNGDEAIRPNETVDSHRVRPTPPVEEEEYTLMDRVEVFRVGLGWRQGLVRGVLSEKRYVVGLESTKEESVFKQSDLRPFQVWESGVWRNELQENPIRKKSLKPMTPITPKRLTNVMNPKGNGKTLLTKATGEIGKKNDEAPMLLLTPPQVTSIEAEETHEKTLEPGKKNQNGGLRINDSTRNKTPEVEKENSKDQPFTAWIRELSTGLVSPVTTTPCLKRKREEDETDISSVQTPVNAALANLPFAKKSPFWKICETLECFKTVPHFSPLSNESNDIREWSAIGMSVTYLGLLDEVKKLRLDDDEDSITNRLNSLSDSFDKLAKHGFDVETPQSRINKIMSLKEMREKKTEEKKRLEEMVEEEDNEKRKLEEKVAEMEGKILELKRAVKDVKKKMIEMKSSGEVIDEEIEDVELEFHKIVSAPW